MPYDDNNYVSEFANQTKPSGQIPSTQTLTTPSYSEDKAMVDAKEIRGGLHIVKYKGLLTRDDIYDGIMASRRVPYMRALVILNDDDTPNGQVYTLTNYPGNVFADVDDDWTPDEKTTINLNNPETVADLADRDVLSATSGKYVNVTDARTAQEISDGDPIYARSFIYDGTQWLTVFGLGSVNPAEVAANTAKRHTQGTDSKLQRTGGSDLTADSIHNHMTDGTKHFPINDDAPEGLSDEVFSSEETHNRIEAAKQNAKDFTYSRVQIDSKVTAASLGISKTYDTIALRNADDLVPENTLALVDEDRGVYYFTGQIGDSGAGVWQFRYYLDVVEKTADVNWNAPSDTVPPTSKAVNDRIEAKKQVRFGDYVNTTTFNDRDGDVYTPNQDFIYIDISTGLTYQYDGAAYDSLGSLLEWGNITGLITDQTDLITLLDSEYFNVESYDDSVDFPAQPVFEGIKIYIDKSTDEAYYFDSDANNYIQLRDTSAVWGQIAGNLADQTDLQAALGTKSNLGEIAGFNPQTGTSYTAVLSDKGKWITMNNAAANEVTIPQNSSVAYPLNSIIIVQQIGDGKTSILADTNVTFVGVASTAVGQVDIELKGGAIVFVKGATNTWNYAGNVLLG